MSLTSWNDRPIEIAHLLNPAFCGEILFQSIREYRKESKRSFPFILSFLVLPLVLHGRTRTSIQQHKRSSLHGWLNMFQESKIGFPERTKMLVPITKEALTFCMIHGNIEITEAGLLRTPRRRPRSINASKESEEYFDGARIVGRWFARTGPAHTIYSMLGVSP